MTILEQMAADRKESVKKNLAGIAEKRVLIAGMVELKRLREEGRNGTEFYCTLKETVFAEAKRLGVIGEYGKYSI